MARSKSNVFRIDAVRFYADFHVSVLKGILKGMVTREVNFIWDVSVFNALFDRWWPL